MTEFDREDFLAWMINDVAANLEDVVGVEGAVGYLGLVGDDVGRRLDEQFQAEKGTADWDLDEVGEVLVELKRRIDGEFRVTAQDEHELVFENSRCPFGDAVVGHPSLCMMTSSVFGRITASHKGYATVTLDETIAEGHGRCLVRVHTDPERQDRADDPNAREYFGDLDDDAVPVPPPQAVRR